MWFLSSLGSSLGDWIGLFALQVLVISLADPGSRIALFGLGGIMMARLLPSVLFGPVAGLLADRYDRKHLMVGADIARGLLYLGVVFSTDLIALFTLAFLVECLSLLYISSKMAVLPGIVAPERLTTANQLALFVTYGPLPFGAAVPTLMVALTGLLRGMGLPDADPTRLALVVTALGFWAAGAVISRMQLGAAGRAADEGQRQGVWQEFREGLEFIRDLPLIRALIVGMVGVFFGAGVIVTLGPEFVRSALGRSETDWFTLMSAVGGGLLVGIVAVPVVTARFREERLFPIFLTVTAAIATSIAVSDSFAFTLGAGLFLGGSAGLSVVLGYTLLLRHTTDSVRGKTLASFYTSTRIAMFAALGFAPFVAGAIGLFTIGAFGQFLTVSGLRITLLAGALVALYSAVRVWRGVYRALALERETPPDRRAVHLDGRGTGPDRPGTFIAFEGVEGAGKSTQVDRLVDALRADGWDVVVTREPGGPPIAENIRALLLDAQGADMHPHTEALLYAAARAEHVRQTIRPALEEGKLVVCDRFLDSSLAYQGYARQLGPEDVYEINRWAVDGIVPDVVVLLDLDPEEGLRRVTADRATDRMEGQDVEFHRRVAQGYQQLAEQDPDRFVVVKAGADPDTVAEEIRDRLQGRVR